MPANPMAVIRIVDDDPEMLASLEFLLQASGWRTVSYSSAQDFLKQDNPLVPGCLLLDVRMPEISGLELQDRLHWKAYSLPIVFMTAHGDIDMAVKAVKNGAIDFITKPIDDERLLAAVSAAVDKDWADRARQNDIGRWRAAYATLTDREKEVAKWVATGIMNKHIALRLGIGEKTVQVHRGAVCKKLNVRSAVEISKILDALGENL